MSKIKAGVIGANGYAGAELVRLLSAHPNVILTAISSRSEEGEPISQVYPAYLKACGMKFCSAQEVVACCDVIFASVPHGASEEYAKAADAGKKVFVDLGADFRLYSEEVYKTWYGKGFDCPELHKKSRYCLPEFNREQIKKTDIIGNPGCYPTSAALALMPALEAGIIETRGIVVDSKSGVTGAGYALSRTTHYAECNESFAPYKVAVHRHTPEIEQILGEFAGEPVSVTFVPHLLPVNRGIVSTCYADLKKGVSAERIREIYSARYDGEKFVRLLPAGACANLKNVRLSNYCDVSLHTDGRAGKLIAVGAIDNMVKGAAGQAIQNMNIRLGFAEDAGLTAIAPAF